VGGHKAYVFMSVLGLTVKDADKLRQSLLAAACSENAVPGHYNQYGQRYTIDYELTTNSGTATVRSAWIIRTGETIPRLVSCYIR
jgi:hypothetical protein